ncbi:glycoside hydrolase family 28 protein [Sphingomonas sp. FW199]|uniref:rhamnogalacturonidase n=1 Tax=Sphingomonas sp. FW199 TaxID=3400217 RepID=UPI003CF3F3AA
MIPAPLPFPDHGARVVDVRGHGAVGDGRTLDTAAINAAVRAAAGGGVVLFPPGRYLSFSIRLHAGVTLVLAAGATLIGADPARHDGAYDPFEDRGDQLYQDFGHSHWHNSLIWGDGISDVAILGPGTIHGEGLTRDGPGARWQRQAGERPLSMAGMNAAEIAELEPDRAAMRGLGNKAIALRCVRNAHIAGLTIRDGGHFAILATGCQDLVIRDCAIDTDRDGIDLDCVARARVERCRVNTPNDDAIVIKTSLALGHVAPSEDIVIRDCTVSGWDRGTMLDGSHGRTQQLAPDRDRVTGRIKIGTESNGPFRRIRIERCRFERSRGLAIECVDGGSVADVMASDLVMTEVTTAPLFVRLGDRRRGPAGTGIGSIGGIRIERVTASGIDPRFAAQIVGLPDHPARDVILSDIRLDFAPSAAPIASPAEPPELADAYPEPSMFGITPAWGLWCRHVVGLTLDRLTLDNAKDDPRPPIRLDDCTGRDAGMDGGSDHKAI